jgi:small GTP-binding protein
MLGDPSVGKTSLIRRFVHDEFSDDYLSTVGAKVSKKDLDVERYGDPIHLHLIIWDIAGQKTFTSVSPSLFKGAEGALVICDLTRRTTLENLNNWIYHLTENAGEIPFVILANKWDLVDERAFELSEAEHVAEGYDTHFLNTSAKTGYNVENAFRKLGELIIEKKSQWG